MTSKPARVVMDPNATYLKLVPPDRLGPRITPSDVSGVIAAHNQLAVGPVVEEMKLLTIMTEGCIDKLFEVEVPNPHYLFGMTNILSADGVTTALAVARAWPDVKRIAVVNPDYAFGRWFQLHALRRRPREAPTNRRDRPDGALEADDPSLHWLGVSRGSPENVAKEAGMFFELRQYHIRPGQRDAWVKCMEEEIIPFQVKMGMVILGSFVGEEDESVYVWIRRFETEQDRKRLYDLVYQSDYWKNEIAPRVPTLIDREQIKVTRLVATPRSVIQ